MKVVGAQLEQVSTKGLWSDREKWTKCQYQAVLVATDNSTVVAYKNKQGGTHMAEMCTLL